MKNSVSQLLRYVVVGVGNTLLTLLTIFACKSLLGINPYISNAIGYAVGLTNSFLWNKKWVFHSSGGYRVEAVRFLVGAGVCYLVQLFVVWGLTDLTPLGERMWHLPFFTLSGYGVATLVGNVVYTLSNFTFNKLITFHRAAKINKR